MSILLALHPGDEKVREGVNAFYNYRYDRAISILTETKNAYPDHPGVHLVLPASKWLHAQAHTTVNESYATLDNDLETAIRDYEELIEKYPENQEYRLYYGSALGLKARISLGKKEWINTLSNAYRGFRIIQDVADKDSSLTDAYLPIGIVEYYAGMSNALIQFAAGLFGLDASKDAGLKKIRKAAEEAPWSWMEASAIITYIYLWSDRDPGEAERFSSKLVNSYPRNFYYWILYTESLSRANKLKEAQESLIQLENAFTDLTKVQKNWFSSYMHFEWALYHFHSGNHEQALEDVSLAIENYGAELDIILGEALLLKGKLLDLSGNRPAAEKAYTDCLDLDNMSRAMNDAETFLQQPYSNAK